MKKNVGLIDRIFRFFFGIFLLWFGLIYFNGAKGEVIGIIVALICLVPFTMTITAKCPVFYWLNISSITRKERENQ